MKSARAVTLPSVIAYVRLSLGIQSAESIKRHSTRQTNSDRFGNEHSIRKTNSALPTAAAALQKEVPTPPAKSRTPPQGQALPATATGAASGAVRRRFWPPAEKRSWKGFQGWLGGIRQESGVFVDFRDAADMKVSSKAGLSTAYHHRGRSFCCV